MRVVFSQAFLAQSYALCMLILALNYLAAQLLMEYAQMANEFKARLTIQRATPASDGGTVSRAPPCSKIRRGGENNALPPLSPFNSPCASTVPATTLPLVDLHDLHGCTPPNRTHRPGLTATPQPPHSALSGWAALPECLAQPRAWKASLRRWVASCGAPKTALSTSCTTQPLAELRKRRQVAGAGNRPRCRPRRCARRRRPAQAVCHAA